MPFYEFQCETCGARAEQFVRSMRDAVTAPACPATGCPGPMARVLSGFLQHLTEGDKVARAEAKWGKQVDDALAQGPDTTRLARRYGKLAKDLPPDHK